MNKIREIKQLYHSANNLFNLGRRGFNTLTSAEKSLKISDLSNAFEIDSYHSNEKKIAIIVSYLSSSAIRVSTIYETLFLKPERNELYRDPLDINNIHFFLRDNIAHKEPDIDEAKPFMKRRQDFIDGLTIEQLYNGVLNSFNACRSYLLQMENDMRNLGKFVRKYKSKR